MVEQGLSDAGVSLDDIDARLGDGWSIRCRNINMQLRDMEYKLQQVKNDAQNLDIWEMEIRFSSKMKNHKLKSDRKSTRLNSSHKHRYRMPSSA